MSLGGVISGLIGGGQSLPQIDISQLMSTIKNAGQYQQQIINSLPAEVQQQIQQYQATNGGAADAYSQGIAGTGNTLEGQVSGLYGPNSAAATAEDTANKQQIYSTVPGTENAVRNAMAATGGLSRGNAGVALAQPALNAAAQYSQSAQNVAAQQTQAGQAATQQALMAVAGMDANMFQQKFGMSSQQAQQILQTGNQALRDQLSQLINSSNNQENKTLDAQGLAAQNGFNNAQTRNAQQGAVWNGLADMGIQGANMAISGMGGMPGIMAGMGGGSDPNAIAGMV